MQINENIELLQGDCLELMKNIEDKSIDMILCDLPYGTTKCKWDSIIPFNELWEQYNKIIKDNGAILLFGAEPFSSKLRLSNEKMYRYDWYWEKDKGTNFGSSRKQPLKKVETISVFYKKQPFYDCRGKKLDKPYKRTLPKNKSEVYGSFSTFSNEEREYVVYTHETKKNIIYFARDNGNRGSHPTQKPIKLLEYLIKTYTNEGETVLDNCMGSGSTGIACINTNRKFIGIELDENYFNIANDRIEKHLEDIDK